LRALSLSVFPATSGDLAEDTTCPTDLTLRYCQAICIHQGYGMTKIWLKEERV